MITQTCVFPLAGQDFGGKALQFDLHYKYVFFSISPRALCVLSNIMT